MKLPISASMVVKNESKNIKGCLDSLSFCDEVIVVDTGSKDNTVEIAKSYSNVKVFKLNFLQRLIKGIQVIYWAKRKTLFHFSKARNYSLSKCKRENWHLIIDADERIYNHKAVEELITKYPEVEVWYLLQVSKIRSGKSSPCLTTRLWKGDLDLQYTKMVHETVDEQVDSMGYKRGKSDLPIEHIGFLDKEFNAKKSERVIDAIEYEGHPYKNYYLGMAYAQANNWEASITYLERAKLDQMPFNIMAHCFAILGDIYRQYGEFYYKIAEERLNHSLKLTPEQNLSYMIFNSIYDFKGLKDERKQMAKVLMGRDTLRTEMHQDAIMTQAEMKECIVQ